MSSVVSLHAQLNCGQQDCWSGNQDSCLCECAISIPQYIAEVLLASRVMSTSRYIEGQIWTLILSVVNCMDYSMDYTWFWKSSISNLGFEETTSVDYIILLISELRWVGICSKDSSSMSTIIYTTNSGDSIAVPWIC